MMATMLADLETGFEVLVVQRAGALRALDPEAFGDPAGFVGRLNGLSSLLEPRHGSEA
jgi:hypothetical protein